MLEESIYSPRRKLINHYPLLELHVQFDLNCDALRAFLRPGWKHFYLNKFQYPLKINVFPHLQKTEFHLI